MGVIFENTDRNNKRMFLGRWGLGIPIGSVAGQLELRTDAILIHLSIKNYANLGAGLIMKQL